MLARSLHRTILLSGCLFALAALSRPAGADSEPNPAPARPPRRIVLCLDGTWNSTYDEAKRSDGTKVLKPTNVLKLCRAVMPHSPTGDQIVYYEIGVGSLPEYPGFSNHLLYLSDKTLGGAYGAGFEANIEQALEFLVQNQQEGDKIFIFGFSRGAATARGLTHFLDWAGGLPFKRDAYYLPLLFREYVDSGGAPPSDKNKKQHPKTMQTVNVEFLGVWDTVMALGARFHATGASTSTVSRSFYVSSQPALCVKNARQALAIDEQRYDFRPEIWTGPRPGQTLEQRWFAGVHSNVGGGYVQDGLADLTFQWMLEEAKDHGLEVDPEYTAHYYKGFPQAQIYSSESPLYRALDRIRFRSGRGVRKLIAQPATANLSLDTSVIRRIETDPQKRRSFGKPYRPQNVLQFLACQPDLDQYLRSLKGLKGATDPKIQEEQKELSEKELQLPADVLKRIGELKPQCGKS